VNYSYDTAGNVSDVWEEINGTLQRAYSYGYDGAGRMTSSKDFYEEESTYTYENGLLVAETDPGENETRYEYDDLNRVEKYLCQVKI